MGYLSDRMNQRSAVLDWRRPFLAPFRQSSFPEGRRRELHCVAVSVSERRPVSRFSGRRGLEQKTRHAAEHVLGLVGIPQNVPVPHARQKFVGVFEHGLRGYDGFGPTEVNGPQQNTRSIAR